MNTGRVPEEFLAEIFKQAQREYPSECCGMIFGPRSDSNQMSRLKGFRNVQDLYHEKDPANFPRTAQTAYFIEPAELLAVHKGLRKKGEEIRVIYHSHIDRGAYFSEEDKRAATPDGEPAYGGADYLVVSVVKGKVKDANLFRWDPKKRDFLL